MTFTVYLLCMYPEVFKRLRAEVLQHIGTTQMPTFDDIRTMKYLRAVINGESLSLDKWVVVSYGHRNAAFVSSCVSLLPFFPSDSRASMP